MNKTQARTLDSAVRYLIMLGFLALPFTHFRWIPDLGTTRPVSAIFFALAFGLLLVQTLILNGLKIRAWLHWPKTWENWPILRWWLWLILLGLVSAAITPFYGSLTQALIRLLGYAAIFMTLFVGAYSLPRYGIKTIARWTLMGYLPILAYAIIESLASLELPWAVQFILWFRNAMIVPFFWGYRIYLMATEPSFVGFQVLLLMLLLPYVTEVWLKWCGWVLVALCMVFTQSGTVIGLAAIYFMLWGLFSLSRKALSRLAMATTGIGGAVLLAGWLIPLTRELVDKLTGAVFSVYRISLLMISVQIRYNYILNLVYALLDTRGLGLGIGQYGLFWKEIYLRHIDYKLFDLHGEVGRALANTQGYMKPWSVILGVGVDLGLAGLALLIGFFWQVYRQLAEPRHRAMFFACLAGLAGAYPIVTPHLWLALALIAGIGLASKQERDAV